MQKAYDDIRLRQKQKKDEDILSLHDRLASDHDARVTTALRDLVSAYAAFQKNINRNGISVPTKGVLLEKVNSLFDGCLKQLDRSHDLCLQQRQLTGGAKKAVTAQRDQIIADVQASIDQMSGTFEQAVDLATNNEGNLSDLRKELETTMRVARRTDERMTEMGLGREKN
jgi:hypothetical protein